MDTNIDGQRKSLLEYTNNMLLPSNDLMQLTGIDKLKLCQITDKSVIKKGPQGEYVPVGYIERCLNFISNFNWGVTNTREGYETTIKKGSNGKPDKLIHQAWVSGDFYIILDGNKIERSCYGTRQMYDNPATSKFAVIEAARSIATKSFADTLGVASDKLSKEFDDQRKTSEMIIDGIDPFVDLKEEIDLITNIDDLRELMKKNQGGGKEIDNYFISHARKLKGSTTANNEQMNDTK